MKIEPEYGGPARHQIGFVPAGEVATSGPLQQRITVPQRWRDKEKGNDDGRDPDRQRVGCPRAQNPRFYVFPAHFVEPPCAKTREGRYAPLVALERAGVLNELELD